MTPLVTLIRSLTRIMITTDTVGSERIHLFDGGFFYGRKRVVLSLRPDFTGEFGPVGAIKCSPGSKKEETRTAALRTHFRAPQSYAKSSSLPLRMHTGNSSPGLLIDSFDVQFSLRHTMAENPVVEAIRTPSDDGNPVVEAKTLPMSFGPDLGLWVWSKPLLFSTASCEL